MKESIKSTDIFKAQFVNNTLYSCQIIATMVALDNLMGNNDNGISIYQKWIKSRGKRDPREATFSLINLFYSISSKGYDEKYPLEVNEKSKAMLGGAHRLGICLFLNIKRVPIVKVKNNREHPKKYDIEYFSSILNDREMSTLKNKIEEVVSNDI
mgnify:CR=1 FL=1